MSSHKLTALGSSFWLGISWRELRGICPLVRRSQTPPRFPQWRLVPPPAQASVSMMCGSLTSLHGCLALESVAWIQNLRGFLHCSRRERLMAPASADAGAVTRVKDCQGSGLAFPRPCGSQNKLADSLGADLGLEATPAGSAARPLLPSRESQGHRDRAQAEKSEQSPGICVLLSPGPGPARPRHAPWIIT